MINIICDRCGKIIEKRNRDNFPLDICYPIDTKKEPTKKIDLCEDCKDELMEWLKGGTEE